MSPSALAPTAEPALAGLARRALLLLDAETAHAAAVATLELLARLPGGLWLADALAPATRKDPCVVAGLSLRNRVGLAAGWDKDARAWPALARLGFGHIEVGTVTPRPQPGNPRPRVFRLREDQALINRMGFPGQGVATIALRLRASRPAGVAVGVNLGRNKATANEDAAADADAVVAAVAADADYIALNVSSPNTPGLRALQRGAELRALIAAVAASRDRHAPPGRRLPLWVKIAPDLDAVGIDAAVEAAVEGGAEGIIIGNTTLARDDLRSEAAGETGGLSGAPLTLRARTATAQVVERADGRLVVVSVGGIGDGEEARIRVEIGADLVQVYTGLIYRGLALVAEAAAGAARGAAARPPIGSR